MLDSEVIGFEATLVSLAVFIDVMTWRAVLRDQQMAEDMVKLMKSRVPDKTGRLLNGISWRQLGNIFEVRASAHRSSGAETAQEDYATFVEHGTHPSKGGSDRIGGGLAVNNGFFARAASSPHPSGTRAHAATPAEPFFYNSAAEIMAQRGVAANAVVTNSARDADFAVEYGAP